MSSLLELLSAEGGRNNLPRPRDAFVGRSLQLEQVSAALDANAVATVVGPPGVGKSRFAVEHGHRFLSDRPGASAWFCDLTAAETSTDVLAAVGRPLGLRFDGGDCEAAVIERIGSVLASLGPTLLILDNAEGHPDVVARCVADWTDRTNRLKVVVTSRRALAETATIDLRPLTSVDAVTLIEARVRAMRPDFRAVDGTRDDLRRLAARLEGLPLALEIVAPRLRLLSPGQLLERLDDSLDPLDAALQRSWELLEPWERRAFVQTSVFRGSFDVPAAEAVVALDDDAPPLLDVLDDLVDHSLARLDTTDEFPDETRLRYPLAVREFARRRLAETDDEPDAVRRHVEYFVEHGERWDDGIDTGDEREATARLVVALPNLLAAWERATGEARVRLGLVLHMALQRGGPFDRQAAITDDTLEGAHEIGDARWIGRAHLARARSRRWRNDFDGCLDDLEDALEHAREAGDLRTEASALRNLAAAHWGRGELDRTREYSAEALRVSRESDNPVEEINSRNGVGFLLAHTGEPDRAQEELEAALAMARDLERAPGLTALVSSSLAALMLMRKQFDQAEFYSTQALQAYRELDYVRSIPMELLGRAEARCASGKIAAARDDVDRALNLSERMGFRTVRLRARHVATLVELLDGRPSEALDQIRRAVTRIDASGDQMLLLGARVYEVIARSMLGQRSQADTAWAAVASLTAESRNDRWRNIAHVAEGFLALARAEDDGDSDDLALASARAAEPFDEDAVASTLARLLRERLPDGEARFRVTEDGRAFCQPGADPVDITRRKSLRGILELLVTLRRQNPGEPATLDDVLEAGWPGEVMTADSGSRRVYVSVKRLRDLGLENLLVTAGDGYMLDPNVPVEFVDAL